MKKIIKIISMFLIINLSIVPVFAQTDNKTFSYWTDNNIYFKNKENLNVSTQLDKANLAYILCEAFDLQKQNNMKNVQIKDVKNDDWYYSYANILINKGILKLDNGYFYPNKFLKREELPEIVSFLPLKYFKKDSLSKYKDVKSIDNKNLNHLQQFIESGYFPMLSNDYILPQRIATIEDMINMLNLLFPNVINNSIDKAYNGNYIVKDNMKSVENLKINGDLYITEGAIKNSKINNSSKIILKNLDVNGNIYIYGGSLNSEYIINTVKTNQIFIKTKNPIVFNITDSNIKEIKNNSELSNFITNVKLNFVK